MASYQSTQPYRSTSAKPERGSNAGLMVLALFLGIAVAVLGMTAVLPLQAADEARDDATAAAPLRDATHDHSGHAGTANSRP